MAFSQDDSARVVLKYGKGEVTLDLSGAANVTYLHENDMPEIPDLDEAFQNAVEASAIGQPLASRVHAGDKVTIVISDLTRFWMRQHLVEGVYKSGTRRQLYSFRLGQSLGPDDGLWPRTRATCDQAAGDRLG